MTLIKIFIQLQQFFYKLSQMFSNFFGFPMINYQPFCYGFYPDQLASHYFPSEVGISLIGAQNSINIQEQEFQENFKLTLTKQDLQQQGIGISKKHWSEQQDQLLKQYAQAYNFDWNEICKKLPGRNQKMCYSRYRRIQHQVKSYWTVKQNQDIKKYFQVEKLSWKAISKFFQNRTAKQIRQHYLNFLRPNIKKQEWTLQQDLRIVEMYNEHGKKWKMFQKHFDGRTQNQIKNRFYGRLKRLQSKKECSKEIKE